MALIVGLKGVGGWHNAGVALVDTEKPDVLFAAEEERYNNVKYTAMYPMGALAGMFREVGCQAEDIRYVAYPFQPDLLLDSLAYQPDPQDALATHRDLRSLFAHLTHEFPNATIVPIDHHFAHAASAYYCSGFPHAAILTVDGAGEVASTTFGAGEGMRISRFAQVNYPHSLGVLYRQISYHLGFRGPTMEGTVMALASYGEPRFLQVFRDHTPCDGMTYTIAINDLKHVLPFARQPGDDMTQEHMDIAASLQARTEEILVEITRSLYKKNPCPNLCLAGGVALNCVANQHILEETNFHSLFIQPAANDGGTPLGAALYVKHMLLGIEEPTQWNGAYLGEGVTFCASRPHEGYWESFVSADLAKVIAEKISHGRYVGWCQGRAEYGPRALGHRSIFADPRSTSIAKHLNHAIKHREWFRPFAPIITEEDAATYFEMDQPSPYMLFAPKVRKQYRKQLAGITHVDGTARVQTLTETDNPMVYALLRAFERRTGFPILLNTSFNVQGEAIVQTAEDAIECATYAGLTTLVLEDHLLTRPHVDFPLWTHDEYLQRRRDRYWARFGDEHERFERMPITEVGLCKIQDLT